MELASLCIEHQQGSLFFENTNLFPAIVLDQAFVAYLETRLPQHRQVEIFSGIIQYFGKGAFPKRIFKAMLPYSYTHKSLILCSDRFDISEEQCISAILLADATSEITMS